jgi:hypothetical protein
MNHAFQCRKTKPQCPILPEMELSKTPLFSVAQKDVPAFRLELGNEKVEKPTFNFEVPDDLYGKYFLEQRLL